MDASFVPYSLSSEAVKLQFVYPVGAIRKFIDRQTLHRRRERNVAIAGSRHSKSDSEMGMASFSFRGSTKLASLFRVYPTAFPTFHAFISSAGYGLSKSTGKWAGSVGAIQRSYSFGGIITGIRL